MTVGWGANNDTLRHGLVLGPGGGTRQKQKSAQQQN